MPSEAILNLLAYHTGRTNHKLNFLPRPRNFVLAQKNYINASSFEYFRHRNKRDLLLNQATLHNKYLSLKYICSLRAM